MTEILAIMAVWIKEHIALIFSGVAGSIVGALLFEGTAKQKFMSFVVGCIMASTLGSSASKLFYNGEMVELFGFCIGISGMTLAKILLIYIDKFAKTKAGINEEEGR